jgi:hypothetical protein
MDPLPDVKKVNFTKHFSLIFKKSVQRDFGENVVSSFSLKESLSNSR